MSGSLEFDACVAAARAKRIEDVIARRGIKLRGRLDLSGPCPLCGGTDRFWVNVRKQKWGCRGCDKRSEDVVGLVMFLDGCRFVQACATLTGDSPPGNLDWKDCRQQPRPPRVPAPEWPAPPEIPDYSAFALELFTEAVPRLRRTVAERYLVGLKEEGFRGLQVEDRLLDAGEVMRFHPTCPFHRFEGDRKIYFRTPALLLLFRDIHVDTPRAIQRIALTPEGRKAPLDAPKLTLGPTADAAIKIDPNAVVEHGLTIGEGAETVLAGRMFGFRPAWALGSSGRIRTFPVLSGIDCLTILVDHDDIVATKNGAGQVCAQECSERWTGAGREVRRIVPRKKGVDVADLVTWQQRG